MTDGGGGEFQGGGEFLGGEFRGRIPGREFWGGGGREYLELRVQHILP